MLFNFITACGISAALIVFLTTVACRDRRRGWVRSHRSNFVEELMTDWLHARAAALPDVTINSTDVPPQAAASMTGDLLALDKRLGRVKVRLQNADMKAKAVQETRQHIRA